MNTMKWAACSLIATALLGLTACSTTEGTEEVDAVETPDGAMIVDTFTTTATVTAINTADRKVTLKTPNGHKTTYKCGPDMVNFSQIAVGDQVKATVSE
ncbi:MAG: hypothetical protein MUC91_08505, partial [Verrucomicrobia bacterium]|nr:hypothetical protein [Verrucomicrobiota bacterium]